MKLPRRRLFSGDRAPKRRRVTARAVAWIFGLRKSWLTGLTVRIIKLLINCRLRTLATPVRRIVVRPMCRIYRLSCGVLRKVRPFGLGPVLCVLTMSGWSGRLVRVNLTAGGRGTPFRKVLLALVLICRKLGFTRGPLL